MTSISDSPDLLRLPFTIPSYSSTPIPTLIDCGASLNFIHEDVVNRLRIDTQPCPPIEVSVVDGRTLPSLVQRQCAFEINEPNLGTYKETFYVASIGAHSVILGMPWLTHVNPDIDWRARTITPRTMDQELPPTPPPTPNPESQPTTPMTATPTGEPKKKKKRKRKKKKIPTESPVAPESIPKTPTVESVPESITTSPTPESSIPSQM